MHTLLRAALAHPSSSPSNREPAHADPYSPIDDDPSYAMVRSGPAVDSDDVEVAHLTSIEVAVLWDTNVLHVAHLTPPRAYYVGEKLARGGCDYFVPASALGTERAPIVVPRGAGAALVVLPRASGVLEIPDHGRVRLEDLVTSGRARPSPDVADAVEIDLPPGARATMRTGAHDLTFRVSLGHAGKRTPLRLSGEPAAFLPTGLSFAVHAGLFAILAFFLPALHRDDAEGVDRDRVLTMQKLLNAAAAREHDETRDLDTVTSAQSAREGGSGARAEGEGGAAGTAMTHEPNRRYAVRGSPDEPDPHLARRAAMAEASELAIGLFAGVTGADPNAPVVPWGRDDATGHDAVSARGNIFGDVIGDATGTGGLGLTGTGEGGDGPFQGIGLDSVGGLDHGGGGGPAQGIGDGRGHLAPAHAPRAPRVRDGVEQVNGRIPAEVIQRIVRQNFGRFRLCYETGMRGNPNLEGRVSVRFVIDRGGSVAMAMDGGSDLPDRNVVQCVVRAFDALSFPQPEGGMVTVVYPIAFSPGG